MRSKRSLEAQGPQNRPFGRNVGGRSSDTLLPSIRFECVKFTRSMRCRSGHSPPGGTRLQPLSYVLWVIRVLDLGTLPYVLWRYNTALSQLPTAISVETPGSRLLSLLRSIRRVPTPAPVVRAPN